MTLAGHLVRANRTRKIRQRKQVLDRLLKLLNKGSPVDFEVHNPKGYGGYDVLLVMRSRTGRNWSLGGFYLTIDRVTEVMGLYPRAQDEEKWPANIEAWLRDRLSIAMPLTLASYPKLYNSLPDYHSS